MKKNIFYLLSILFVFFYINNVYAYTSYLNRLSNGTDIVARNNNETQISYDGSATIYYNNISMNISSNVDYTFSANYTFGFLYNRNDQLVVYDNTQISLVDKNDNVVALKGCSTSVNRENINYSGGQILSQFGVSITCKDFNVTSPRVGLGVRLMLATSLTGTIGPILTKSVVNINSLVLERSDGLTDNDLSIINNNQNTDKVINNNNQNTQEIIDNQNKNQEETNEKLEEAENTRKGILGFIQNIFDGIVHLPENIWNFIKGGFELIGNAITGLFDGLKGIFLPEPVCKTSPNLLPTNKDSYTLNGVTVTNNNDGTYTLNGTTTAISKFFFYQGDSITLPAGTYTGSSFSNRMVFIRMNSSDYQSLSNSKLSTMSFTLSSSFTFNNLYLYTEKGVTFNNEVVKPMLVEGSSIGQFEPFGETCEKTSFWTWFQRLGDMIGNFFSNLLNGILDGLKALFIPDDDYFTNKFDELTDKVENKMGVLAYPLTITIRTFEFLLTVNDTGSYVISWNDITVPNFEEYVIIKKGSFDLSDLLKNFWIKMAHTLYMTFVSAYLLLAFFKFCNNKYSDMFGGDYDNTDYIFVEESIVDVHETENGKRYVNHKERRYKVSDE